MKPTNRIGLILLLVFLLPALSFSVYEISSLNKDEKMIQDIYNKQLEAILFSVNQYSDDILNSWISKIASGTEQASNEKMMPEKINELLTFNSSLAAIFICDTVNGKTSQHFFSIEDSIRNKFEPIISAALTRDHTQIDKLVSYKRSGFQKITALHADSAIKNLQCLTFITGDDEQNFRVVAILIYPETFIEDLIGPRLQVIARDQFILSVFQKNEPTPLYSTLSIDSTAISAEARTKDFWLFPDYTLGIRTNGSSLQSVIQERTTTNLILLIALDVILVIAIILVFQNVKREVQLAQNKADFVSNVSHEIRTPLALISMFAETLEMGRVKSEEKKIEYYGIISKETHRLSGIVNKILNFSQMEANKKTLNLETLHAGTELKEILKTYDFHLTNKGFNYSLQNGDDVWIRADKEAFVEVIINLIDNAIKYSTDKKQLEISTGTENDYGTIAVKDHGVGISTMDQKHIFDKFYRVSSGNLAKSRGTGLGLSLVKQLMTAQRGKILVSSKPGEGSTFTLYFPLEKNTNGADINH